MRQHAHTDRAAEQSTIVKSFGRPLPVLCDDEAGWFDAPAASPADVKKAAQAYIRERFVDLLPQDDIEMLAANEVMLQIVARHRNVFQQAHAGADAA